MRSFAPGKGTSKIEVEIVSSRGFWLLIGRREYVLSFLEHPWFQDAPLSAIRNVRLLGGAHLHWPDLDADLELDAVEHPERYPLIDRHAGASRAATSSLVADRLTRHPRAARAGRARRRGDQAEPR